jgi:hypothetical protein
MGHVTDYGKNATRILMRKHECQRPLRKPRHRWEKNIKMDYRIKKNEVDYITRA